MITSYDKLFSKKLSRPDIKGEINGLLIFKCKARLKSIPLSYYSVSLYQNELWWFRLQIDLFVKYFPVEADDIQLWGIIIHYIFTISIQIYLLYDAIFIQTEWNHISKKCTRNINELIFRLNTNGIAIKVVNFFIRLPLKIDFAICTVLSNFLLNSTQNTFQK